MIDRSYKFAECLLKVDDVTLQYGDKLILRNINLNIDNIIRPGMAQGQTVALVGGSGVGKTQLFRIIAGLQKPTSGGVFTCAPTSKLYREVVAGEIGVVFQSYPLLNHRTIWGNLKLAAAKHKAGKDKIDFYLDRFGLTDKKSLFPGQLSGGQRQRVAIIQQMLCGGNFILMDEPFSGLDVKMKTEVCKVINEVAIVDEKNTTIVTTHDIETAIKIADTVWVLGFEKDAAGQRIPGAVVVRNINLIERGFTWLLNPSEHPNFIPTVREIEDIFMKQ